MASSHVCGTKSLIYVCVCVIAHIYTPRPRPYTNRVSYARPFRRRGLRSRVAYNIQKVYLHIYIFYTLVVPRQKPDVQQTQERSGVEGLRGEVAFKPPGVRRVCGRVCFSVPMYDARTFSPRV